MPDEPKLPKDMEFIDEQKGGQEGVQEASPALAEGFVPGDELGEDHAFSKALNGQVDALRTAVQRVRERAVAIAADKKLSAVGRADAIQKLRAEVEAEMPDFKRPAEDWIRRGSQDEAADFVEGVPLPIRPDATVYEQTLAANRVLAHTAELAAMDPALALPAMERSAAEGDLYAMSAFAQLTDAQRKRLFSEEQVAEIWESFYTKISPATASRRTAVLHAERFWNANRANAQRQIEEVLSNTR